MLDNAKLLVQLGQQAVRRQLAKRRLSARMERSGLERGTDAPFRCAVYFSDDPVNLYQIRQWYAPLQELAKTQPVVVISRMPETTSVLLDECPLPVMHGPRVTDIEAFMAAHEIGLVLYVNQNVRNFQMLRFAEPAHVFVSHGESDKSYMASNQLKAYDRVFIAGPAAAERLRGALVEFDVDARAVEIGRPQADVTYEAPQLPDDGRTTILYAPTWEGDRQSMAYGSIATHGAALLTSLLADRRFRVVYRPHPRSGTFDPAYGTASTHLARLVAEANHTDPAAGHLVDTETAFGWHLARLDACITDISAVALDWLATGKPLVLTRPANPRADVEPTRLNTSVPMVEVDRAREIIGILDDAMSASDDSRTEVVRHYFGDTSPGAATQRFVRASTDLIEARLTRMVRQT
ncbi:CDP-glycerol glycerophosphotransferase family protein [Terracoccus sp. 273MFTsu3.1]|uniref:CDP-glycerol glycerophosphotransferase family protein n=1 Tax=Terracoccus sp. 273MFTsu3.1 TaxID=1172188 RepID=UPI00036A34F9|nr:CDP-glycerol glycerophosphotransferase family protein [Terracoccus sp. 273MFTsu3.1]